MNVLGKIVLGIVTAMILFFIGSGVLSLVFRTDNSGPIKPPPPPVSTAWPTVTMPVTVP